MLRWLLALTLALAFPLSLRAQSVEAGGLVLVSDEDALDVSDARAFVSLTDIEVPAPGDTYTGVTFEAGYTSDVVWSVWSTNRTEIKKVIAGADVRIARGGPQLGSAFDVAFRIVGGYRITDELALYTYFLEDQTPFSFAIGWRF